MGTSPGSGELDGWDDDDGDASRELADRMGIIIGGQGVWMMIHLGRAHEGDDRL